MTQPTGRRIDPYGKRKHWTQAEVSYLVREWGAVSLQVLSRHLGRAPRGIQAKASELGLGPANRGLVTVYVIEREYGYDRERIHKAMEHLGIRLTKGNTRTTSARKGGQRGYIPDSRVEDLLSFLATYPDGKRLFHRTGKRTEAGVWGIGIKPPACLDCGTAARPHAYGGKCASCQTKAYKARKAGMGNKRAIP